MSNFIKCAHLVHANLDLEPKWCKYDNFEQTLQIAWKCMPTFARRYILCSRARWYSHNVLGTYMQIIIIPCHC